VTYTRPWYSRPRRRTGAANIFAGLEFDVNANEWSIGGSTSLWRRANGTGCNGFLLGMEAVSQCWTRRSASELQLQALEEFKKYTWILPKEEIARHPGSFVQFIVQFLERTGSSSNFPSRPFINPDSYQLVATLPWSGRHNGRKQ